MHLEKGGLGTVLFPPFSALSLLAYSFSSLWLTPKRAEKEPSPIRPFTRRSRILREGQRGRRRGSPPYRGGPSWWDGPGLRRA